MKNLDTRERRQHRGRRTKSKKENDAKPVGIYSGDQSTSTAGLVGLPPSAVSESQRITLKKKIEAFRNDPEANELVLPANLVSSLSVLIQHHERYNIESSHRPTLGHNVLIFRRFIY